MLKQLSNWLKDHQDLIVYLILGVATTAVNFIVYYPLLNIYNCPAFVSNIVAWTVAVLFAFVTNKIFAFKSKLWTLKVVLSEMGKFVACRILSGAVETLFLALTVDLLVWNGNVMKVLISILVIIMNYIASKFFVFRK